MLPYPTRRLRFALPALALLISGCGAVPERPIQATLPASPATQAAGRPASPAPVAGTLRGTLRFEHLGLEEGLSQSSVQAVLQDRRGFLWLGTQDGLNRYDGYQFKVYKPVPDDPSSLSDRWITAILEDDRGNLWFGTRLGGLNKYDPAGDRFEHFVHDPADAHTLSDNNVRALYQDRAGALWVGTAGGLNRLDPRTGTFTRFVNDLSNTASLGFDDVRAIVEDQAGNLWIGTYGAGLERLDRTSGTFTRLIHEAGQDFTLSDDRVVALTAAGDGDLWVGTAAGLNRFHPATTVFTRYLHQKDRHDSLSDDWIEALRVDHAGALWIGTDSGLDRLAPGAHSFTHYRHSVSLAGSLSDNSILAIYEDRENVLWVGTYSGGLNKYNRSQENFNYYRNDPDDPRSLSDDAVFAIYPDRTGAVWIGTLAGGLNRFDPKSGDFTQFRHDPENPDSLAADSVWSIFRDRGGRLWIGTKSGLDLFDERTGRFTHFVHDDKKPESLAASAVYAIYEDQAGQLWTGTRMGLDRMERETGTFVHALDPEGEAGTMRDSVIAIREDSAGNLWIGTFTSGLYRIGPDRRTYTYYRSNAGKPGSLSNDSVLDITSDRSGGLWIGTAGGGLNSYDPETDSFIAYTEADGLPNNVVYAAAQDAGGEFWLSTNFGISRFDPASRTFKNFTVADGLQSNEFNMGAGGRAGDDTVYFGGVNGLTAFRPADLRFNALPPPVVLTSASQDGKPIELAGAPGAITLRWPYNGFEFEIAALSFTKPERNQFAYKLENFDGDWNQPGTVRNGRYTNLPGGSYRLLIRGSNNEGVWNETGSAISIQVIPPLWETWWFRGLALVGFALLVTAGFRMRVRGIQQQKRRLEQQVTERTQALESRNREMEALYRADERMLRAITLAHVLQALVDVAADLLHADRSAVLVWDPAEEVLQPQVARGFRRKTLESLRLKRRGRVFEAVLDRREPVLVSDTESDLVWCKQPTALVSAFAEEGLRSVLMLPLVIENGFVGLFILATANPRAFDDDRQRLFASLAQRAMLSIENAQLFKQSRDMAVLEERNRLAGDLHDNAKQKAFAALAQLGTARNLFTANPGAAGAHMREAENLVSEVIQELTFLIQEIYPVALQEKGLAASLRDYLFEWEARADIRAGVTVTAERRLAPEIEQAIFRIVQEALANIARHSHATHATLSVHYTAEHVEVVITDDGRGFQPGQSTAGIGLRLIRERVDSLGGSLVIDSATGGVTRVAVNLPTERNTVPAGD